MLDMEKNRETFDEWRFLVSSPKAIDSEVKPMPESLNIEKIDDQNNDMKVKESTVVGGWADATGRSIAERRAAKCGFNASMLNMAKIESNNFPASSLPAAPSPYLTIPTGISPTALLDSPIMLPNNQAQPSPTTGSFPFPLLNHESLLLGLDNQILGADLSYQTLASLQPSTDFEFPCEFPEEATVKNCATDPSAIVNVSRSMIVNAKCVSLESCHTDVSANEKHWLREPINGEGAGTKKDTCTKMGMSRTAEDGYNWRKYGQKQVKGSEYPRSYYKCTHSNCQVKKKVERSYDGQITEIIYKGAHHHPKPQPNRRTILGSLFTFNEMPEMGEEYGSSIKVEGGTVWKNIPLGYKDVKVCSDWRTDGLERTSSASVVTEISDPLSTQGKSIGVFEAGTPELSSTLASHGDDDEDEATLGTISLGDCAANEDSESKRRKKDSYLMELNMSPRALREPRVVVQIESEVDILDDGYRWRKYGQKVVKGNPNPRSYYKCTGAGCPVRKHVERASHNLKYVITTYEGKHNHEVPAGKNTSHVTSGVRNVPPTASTTHPTTLTLPRNANPEAPVQDHLAFHFETKTALSNNEFVRPMGMLGSFGTSMKFGANSSIYQMKFPLLQNPMPYGSSLVLNPSNHNEALPACSPNFPMSLSVTGSANMALPLGGLEFSHGKPIGCQDHLSFLRDNDVRFLKPKQEQDDYLFDARMPVVGHGNAASSSSLSVFCPVIGNSPS